MRSGIIAKKLGMSRVFTDAGDHVPVTVLQVESCQVVAHRTQQGPALIGEIGGGALGQMRRAGGEQPPWQQQ